MPRSRESIEKQLATRKELGPRLPRSEPAERRVTAPVRVPRATGSSADAMRGGS